MGTGTGQDSVRSAPGSDLDSKAPCEVLQFSMVRSSMSGLPHLAPATLSSLARRKDILLVD